MSEDLFSVLAAIGIIALVYRWFTTTPTNSTASSNGLNSAGSLTALQRRAMNLPRAQVDRLLNMFPQLSENEVRYALVVTRGGPEAVAERVLIRGGLEPPPANFFPQTTTNAGTPGGPGSNGNTPSTSTPPPAAFKLNPSLIKKLNLEEYKREQDEAIIEKKEWKWEDSHARKLASSSSHQDQDQSAGSSSNNLLKDRKSKMVLEARWKLLQKDRKGKSIAAN